MEEENNLLYFLAFLLLGMIAYPFLEGSGWGEIALQILFSATLVSGVMIVSEDKRQTKIAAVLALPTILSSWAAQIISQDKTFLIVSFILSIIFYTYTIVQIFRYIKRAEITNKSIYAAVCIYLIMGILWGLTYLIIDHFTPNSFLENGKIVQISRTQSLYYSYMTLTTTGYGDIVPTNKYSRTAASIESVTGVLYVAVLISRLVGAYK